MLDRMFSLQKNLSSAVLRYRSIKSVFHIQQPQHSKHDVQDAYHAHLFGKPGIHLRCLCNAMLIFVRSSAHTIPSPTTLPSSLTSPPPFSATMSFPTKQSFLANIPLVSQPAEEKCPICMEAYEAKPVYTHGGDLSDELSHRAVQTPCGHIYGENCLTTWLTDQPSCPTCRRALYAKQPRTVDVPYAAEALILQEQADEERAAVVEEMQRFDLDLSHDDAENRAELAGVSASLITGSHGAEERESRSRAGFGLSTLRASSLGDLAIWRLTMGITIRITARLSQARWIRGMCNRAMSASFISLMRRRSFRG